MQKWKRLVNPLLLLICALIIAYYWETIFSRFGLASMHGIEKVGKYGIGTILWFSLAFLVNRTIDVLIWEYLFFERLQATVPRLIRDVIATIVYFFAILGIFGVVFDQSITGLLAASGAVSIVVGLAIRNVISDLFNGVALNLDHPFKIGEYVYLHDPTLNVAATVVEITWRSTRFETVNRNTLIVPNSKLAVIAVTNMSRNERVQFDFKVTLDTSVPVERALILLSAAMKSAEGVLREPAPSVAIGEFNENGVIYGLYYFVDRRVTLPFRAKHNIIVNLLRNLQQAGIPFSIPRSMVLHAPLQKRDHSRAPAPDYFIDRISLFKELDESERTLLCSQIIEHRLKAETVVIEHNAPGDTMFIVVEGLLEVFIPIGEDKTLKSVAYLSSGDFFGEMSLLTGEPRSAQITANTDVILYEISKQTLTEIVMARPVLAEYISKTVAARKAQNEQTHADADASSAEQRQNAQSSLATQIFAKMKSFLGLQ